MSFINWGSESPEQLRLRRELEEQVLLEQAMYSAATAASAAGSGGFRSRAVYYLRATESGEDPNSEPWDAPNNVQEMNAVFGSRGWTLGLFETLDPVEVFVPATQYVFIDGSDAGAEELKIFLAENGNLIEHWVDAGGRLFLNAAPNEGGNIGFGFGGVDLIFDGEVTGSDDAAIAAGAEEHPIFTGPGDPGTAWTGHSFAHAILTGDFANLIVNPGEETLCAELEWGAGIVIFGGMTITEFQEPQPEATNLRKNIHSYLSGKGYAPPAQLRSRRALAKSEVARTSRR